MPIRCCDRCAFVGRVHNGDPGELICVNCPVALGQPVRVTRDGVCPNFRVPTVRRAETEPLPLPTPPNENVRYIRLSRNEFAMVDAADFDELNKYRWTAQFTRTNVYAVRWEKGKSVYMHRQIMQPPPGKVTDHYDHNGRNNCRSNLRNCDPKENAWHSRGAGSASGFKDVWYDKRRARYYAKLGVDGHTISLGSFADPVEAAHVRDRKAADVQGPYAFLNLPDDMEPRPIPPDPNHPERPVRMTGPYGYLRCPPYLPPLPDGTWPTYPRLWGAARVLRLVAWAQDHPSPPTAETQPPEPPQDCHPCEGREPGTRGYGMPQLGCHPARRICGGRGTRIKRFVNHGEH